MESKKLIGNLLNMTNQQSSQFKGLPAFKEIYDYGYGKLETINFIHDTNFFTIEYPLLLDNSSKTIENILKSFDFLDSSNSNNIIDPAIELG